MPKKFGKKQQEVEQVPLLFTMGELDLIFRIDFQEEDLEKEESQSKSKDKESNKGKSEYYKFEDINSLKDLSFIKDNDDLIDRIKLKPGNESMKLLLIGNKNAKKRVQTEYICFGRPKFEDDLEFFDDIFDSVTRRYDLIINKTPLDEGGRFSLKIEMKYGKEIKSIQIGKTIEEAKNEKEKENENEKEKEENKNNEEESNMNINNNDEENKDLNNNTIPKVDFEVVLTRFERIWKPIISRGVVNSMLGIYVFEYDTLNWKKKCINFNTVEFMPQNEVSVKFSLKDVNPKGFIIMPVTYGEGIKGPFLIMAKCKTRFTFTQLDDNFE